MEVKDRQRLDKMTEFVKCSGLSMDKNLRMCENASEQRWHRV